MDRILLKFMISGAPDHCDLVDKPFELVIYYLFIIGSALISVVQLESLGKNEIFRDDPEKRKKSIAVVSQYRVYPFLLAAP